MDIRKIETDLDNFKNVEYRMDNEGIEYCFKSYSSWEEIEDEEFHKLRLELLESMKKIRTFVENKIETLTDEVDNFDFGNY